MNEMFKHLAANVLHFGSGNLWRDVYKLHGHKQAVRFVDERLLRKDIVDNLLHTLQLPKISLEHLHFESEFVCET